MSTIATCGHELKEGEGNMVYVKDHSREGGRAISYRTVCDACLERYQKEGLILNTKEEMKLYLKYGV